MPIPVTIGGPNIDGLELMSPADPGFDTAIRSLFRGNSDLLLKLKPFLTILSNHRDRTLVAYALRWDITGPEGRQLTTSQAKYPDAVAPSAPRRGNEVRPGELKIDPMSIELQCGRWGDEATEDFYLHQFVSMFAEYQNASRLEIGIDAAIFEDGEFLGPNRSQLDQDFRAYVDAKQGYYRAIVQAIDSGMSLDQAMAPVEAVVKANMADPGLDWFDRRKTWQRIAAPEVRGWQIKYGDRAAELYRRALRTEPFVVRGGIVPGEPEEERVLAHVACPRCRHSPKSTDRWQCSCGHRWNTFDTKGCCPACTHQWTETACPKCGEWSSHADWYIRP